MSRFVIETTYHLPVYRQRIYEAASLKDACRLAIADEGWEDEEQDVDTSGDTFVTGIWENAERAYQGTARIIPDEFREIIQRKARGPWDCRRPISGAGFHDFWMRWRKRMRSKPVVHCCPARRGG